MRIELRVTPAEQGLKLEHFLRRRGISLALIRSLKYEETGLALNGARARSNAPVRAGDVAALCLPEAAEHSARPEDLPLAIVYEDEDLMVVDKPAGQVVHPSASHHAGTLANAWCGLMARRGGCGAFRPVGRLDGDTSGLMLCAKHAAAAPALAKSVRKAYLALAGGHLPPGRGSISAPLGPAPPGTPEADVRGRAQRVDDAGGKPSMTEYEVVAAGEAASLVAVWPQTGRTHQIRVHFMALGHPLLGDALYGGDCRLIGRQALHCAALRFASPLFAPAAARPGERTLASALPQDMAAVAAALPGAALEALMARLAEWP